MSRGLADLFNRGWWPHWLGESSPILNDVQTLECRRLAIGYASQERRALLSRREASSGCVGAQSVAIGSEGRASASQFECEHGSGLHAGLELRFEAGLLHGILGENGSGKSCLIKTLAGLVKPLAGDILLRRRDASLQDGEARRGPTWQDQCASTLGAWEQPTQVGNEDDLMWLAQSGRATEPMAKRSAWQGYLQQEAQVHWDLPVRDVIALGASARRDWSRAQRHAAVEQAMAACECLSLAARPVLQLSTGERQRVMLARVLAAQPKVLLVDEPTAGLDPRHQHGIMQLLREVAQSGVIVIAVMHDIELTRRYCDTALLLNRSQCLHFASAGEGCKNRSQCLNFASDGVGCKDQALGANVVCKDHAPGAGFAQGPVHEVLTVEAVRRVFGIG